MRVAGQGCGFFMAPERNLNRAGIPLNKFNIWEDPAHADTVRSVANGSETVPTVVVGATALVNPRVRQLIEALEVEAPHLIPENSDEPGPLGRVTERLFGG